MLVSLSLIENSVVSSDLRQQSTSRFIFRFYQSVLSQCFLSAYQIRISYKSVWQTVNLVRANAVLSCVTDVLTVTTATASKLPAANVPLKSQKFTPHNLLSVCASCTEQY